MHGQNCRNPAPRSAMYGQTRSFALVTLDFKELSKGIDAEVERLRIDIHEVRCGAYLDNRFNSGDEGIRNRNHAIACLDSRGHQGKSQSIRAVTNSDAMFRTAEFCKLPFKFFDQRPAREYTGLQYASNDANHLLFKFEMWSHKIHNRHSIQLSHSALLGRDVSQQSSRVSRHDRIGRHVL